MPSGYGSGGYGYGLFGLDDVVETTPQDCFLIELETGVRVRDWVSAALFCDSGLGCDETSVDCAGRAGVFTRTFDAGDVLVIGAKADGVSLTAVATAALVITTPLSFHFDYTTRVLTVHATDSDDQSATVFVAIILEPLAYAKSIVKTRGAIDVFWDGRVKSLPSITQSFNADELGGGAVTSYGTMTIANDDGRYDSMIGNRSFNGQAVRIYKGRDVDDFTSFVLHATAIVEEPSISVQNLVLTLTSIQRQLDAPLLTSLFTQTTYPACDPRIVGIPIPKIWGSATKAQAFRIASGRWKIAGHAVTSIDTVVDKDNVGIAIVTTDLANGEFTVSATHDTKDRLYVDCRGYDLTYIGETGSHLLGLAGFSAYVDSTAFDEADGRRPITVGFQALGGTVAEALTLLVQSGFMDWRITREGLITLVVKRRDLGNLVNESDFESGAANWTTGNGAIFDRIDTTRFRGDWAAQITRPGGSPTAYAAAAGLQLQADKMYTATLVVALISGATTTFRLSLVGSDNTEYFSDDFTLTGTDFTRVTVTFPGLVGDVVLCDSTSTFTNDNTLTCDLDGGQLRIYPKYQGGAGDVVVVIDDVEVVETIVLEDWNAEFLSAVPRGPVIWRVRVPYEYDGRLGLSLFTEKSDTVPQRLYPISESRAFSAEGKALNVPVLSNVVEQQPVTAIRSSADSTTVGQAIFDYFSTPRMRGEFAGHDITQTINAGSVLTVNLTRRPSTPGDTRLYRVISVTEEYPEGGKPMYRLLAEAQYDPVYKIAATVIA